MRNKKNAEAHSQQEPEMEEALKNENVGGDEKIQDGEMESVEETPLDELEILKNKSLENFEGWQRERADFLNYKKRIEREQLSLKNFIIADIVKKYLAVLDDMDLAFKNRPTCSDCQDWANGIGLIHQKLKTTLENEGIEPIPADGLEFDPNVHEAITQIDSPDHESGTVVEVMRQGYKIGDRIIRPALVIVAR